MRSYIAEVNVIIALVKVVKILLLYSILLVKIFTLHEISL